MSIRYGWRGAACALAVLCVACITPRDYGDDDDDSAAGTDAGRPGDGELYHPAGYGEASFHGPDSNLQAEDCRECHGADLRGGNSAVSCDDSACHKADWRTDCTFCHGGADTLGGAPPRDLDGTTDTSALRFRAHTSHVSETRHAPFACTQCHADATDVLSPGHAFDDTPGRAEVTFAGGLSAGGSYDGGGTCSNLYCHGTGVIPGSASQDDPATQCNDCHASSDVVDLVAWGTMSGDHAKHLKDGVTCGECHGDVADAGDNIVNPALHVDGAIAFKMEGTGISYSSGLCTGFCHSKGHFFSGW